MLPYLQHRRWLQTPFEYIRKHLYCIDGVILATLSEAFVLLTRVHQPWYQKLRHPSFGPMTYKQPARIVTRWHPSRSTCICAGHNYLVIVDRYSNWPIVNKANDRNTVSSRPTASLTRPEFVAHRPGESTIVSAPYCRGVKTTKRAVTLTFQLGIHPTQHGRTRYTNERWPYDTATWSEHTKPLSNPYA